MAMAMAMAAKLCAPLSLSLSSAFSGIKICSSPCPRPPFCPPPPQRLPIQAVKKIRGKVVCSTSNKTVAVEVFRISRHRKYKKSIKTSKKYHAHDPDNKCKVGDFVTLVKCAPVSKLKKFLVADIGDARGSPAKPKEQSLPPLESAAA